MIRKLKMYKASLGGVHGFCMGCISQTVNPNMSLPIVTCSAKFLPEVDKRPQQVALEVPQLSLALQRSLEEIHETLRVARKWRM